MMCRHPKMKGRIDVNEWQIGSLEKKLFKELLTEVLKDDREEMQPRMGLYSPLEEEKGTSYVEFELPAIAKSDRMDTPKWRVSLRELVMGPLVDEPNHNLRECGPGLARQLRRLADDIDRLGRKKHPEYWEWWCDRAPSPFDEETEQ